jgi:hypothetical protein
MAGTADRTRTRARLETVLAVISGALAAVTLLSRDWLEVFGWEPDGGNGLLEWVVVAALAVSAVLLGLAARTHWRLSVKGSSA